MLGSENAFFQLLFHRGDGSSTSNAVLELLSVFDGDGKTRYEEQAEVEDVTQAAGQEAEPEFDHLVSQFFPNLFITMLTLLQFATLDGPGVIYGAMIPFKPMTLSIFFVLYILVVSLSLMNLVTDFVINGVPYSIQRIF